MLVLLFAYSWGKAIPVLFHKEDCEEIRKINFAIFDGGNPVDSGVSTGFGFDKFLSFFHLYSNSLIFRTSADESVLVRGQSTPEQRKSQKKSKKADSPHLYRVAL